jgi:probable rRNA maturation factor
MKKAPSKPRPPRGSESCLVIIRQERGLPWRASRALVRRAAEAAARGSRTPCTVSILLAGDATLAALNARHRGIPASTDVLSFPAGEREPGEDRLLLGDIAVSLPKAEAQARARRRPPERELELLVVHGVLHLRGYDHDTAARKARMWRAQRTILEALEAERESQA